MSRDDGFKAGLRRRKARKTLAVLVAIMLAVGLIGVPTAMAAQPKKTPMMVALGDSFTSGTGNQPSGDGSDSCRRSNATYAAVAAQSVGTVFRNLACSGATIGNLWADYNGDPSQMKVLRQLALKNDVRHVVMTIGGNDVAMYESLMKQFSGQPTPGFDSAVAQLPERISETIRWVNWLAPDAEIYISTYPDLLPRTRDEVAGCVGSWLAQRSNPAKWTSLMDKLNGAITKGVATSGIAKAHVVKAPSFAGHSVCSEDPWAFRFMNHLGSREGAFHPNGPGHRAMAGAVVTKIGTD